jgi:hypothetical protein
MLFEEALKSNPPTITKRKFGRFTNLILKQEFEKHPIFLEVIEDENKTVKRVTYLLFTATLPSSMFIKNIIGNLFISKYE